MSASEFCWGNPINQLLLLSSSCIYIYIYFQMNDSELLDFLLSDAGVDGVNNGPTRSSNINWGTGYGTGTGTDNIISGDNDGKDKAIAEENMKGEDTVGVETGDRSRKKATRRRKKTNKEKALRRTENKEVSMSTSMALPNSSGTAGETALDRSYDGNNHSNDTNIGTLTENLDNLILSGSNNHTETKDRQNSRITVLGSVQKKKTSKGDNNISQELDNSSVPSKGTDRDNSNGISIRKKRGKRSRKKKEEEQEEEENNDRNRDQRYDSSLKHNDDNKGIEPTNRNNGSKGPFADEQRSHSNGVTKKSKSGTRQDSKATTTTKDRRERRRSYEGKIEKVRDTVSTRDIRNKLRAEGLKGSHHGPTQRDTSRGANSSKTHRKSKYDYYMRDTDPNLMIVEY